MTNWKIDLAKLESNVCYFDIYLYNFKRKLRKPTYVEFFYFGTQSRKMGQYIWLKALLKIQRKYLVAYFNANGRSILENNNFIINFRDKSINKIQNSNIVTPTIFSSLLFFCLQNSNKKPQNFKNNTKIWQYCYHFKNSNFLLHIECKKKLWLHNFPVFLA